MIQYSAEVNREDMHRLQLTLRSMQNKAPRHVRNALNRTLTQANRTLNKGRASSYVIRAGTFKKSVDTYRATPKRLDAVIKVHDNPHSLGEDDRYQLRGSNFSGYTVRIRRGQWAEIVGKDGQKAFAAGVPWNSKSGKSGTHFGLFIRQEKKSWEEEKAGGKWKHTKIHYASGPGSAKMAEMIYEGRANGEAMERRVQDRLQREIEIELEKIMGAR